MSDDAGKARWLRLSALFDHAYDLAPSARAAFIDSQCADDPSLREALARMLSAADSDSVLDAGAMHLVTPGLAPDACEGHDDSGRCIGIWRLQHLLGRGGMGEVYMALREDDSGQRAALKRLRSDGGRQIPRFVQERRILAALSHANIPALIDHGVDDEGRPWFALEYVDGQALTDWADGERLDLRARIGLFQQVCAAVQHAHEHFVVHRDLKPGNILVDGDGRVRVLDFGVAKVIDEQTDGATRTGLFAGFTPEYAAPEQVSGGAITAATDVYALGVILYQLLCGRLPYALDGNDLRAMANAISTRSPQRPEHAIVTGSQDDVQRRLAARASDLRGFRRFVRGDLGRILQTAMAKEPARRYASVQRFSEDLQRFLQGRTVSVGGDTFVYRARKFIGRNRVGVAMGVLAAAALVAGAAGIVHQMRQAHAAAARAEREAARAQEKVEELTALNTFFGHIFIAGSANNARDGRGTTTLAGALDYALGVARKDYSQSQPRMVLRIFANAASSYESLHELDKAEALVREALQLQETRAPDAMAERGLLLASLASLRDIEEPEQALRWAEEAVALLERVESPDYHDLTVALSTLMAAQYLNDRHEDALATIREAKRIQREIQLLPPTDLNHINALTSEALLLGVLERNEEAVSVHEQTVRLGSEAFGGDAPLVAEYRLDFAFTLNELGRYPRALAELERALPVLEASAEEGTMSTSLVFWALAQQGRAMLALDRVEEAVPPLARAYAGRGEFRSAGRQATVARWYATALARSGRCDDARPLIAQLARSDIEDAIEPAVTLDGTACAP